MPELPEVETVRRGLNKFIVGRTIRDITVLNEKSFDASASDRAALIGARVVGVRRRGKLLIIDLNNPTGSATPTHLPLTGEDKNSEPRPDSMKMQTTELTGEDKRSESRPAKGGQAGDVVAAGWVSLLCHLKMTGQMVYRGEDSWGAGHPNESFVGELPDRSTRVIFTFDDGSKLFFNDQRKFGRILFWPTDDVNNFPFIKKLGPEPFNDDGLTEFLKRAKRHQNAPIKAVILDQSVVAGIGNIYADEALWSAKIHPATRVKDLSDAQLTAIYHAAGQVMTKSIESGGSSMKNYVKADGSRGDYLDNFAKVFNRTGQPCERCGAEIIKTRVAGRGTHICPRCQQEYRR